MTHGVLPPTINLDDPDPACDMDFIPNTARTADVDAALCNCLGLRIEEQRPRAGARAVSSAHGRRGHG